MYLTGPGSPVLVVDAVAKARGVDDGEGNAHPILVKLDIVLLDLNLALNVRVGRGLLGESGVDLGARVLGVTEELLRPVREEGLLNERVDESGATGTRRACGIVVSVLSESHAHIQNPASHTAFAPRAHHAPCVHADASSALHVLASGTGNSANWPPIGPSTSRGPRAGCGSVHQWYSARALRLVHQLEGAPSCVVCIRACVLQDR